MSVSRGYLVVIFLHFLAWFESDEGEIENIMNDSDTEFVAEDESVISTNIITNIIRKEEIGDQSSSVSVPEASTHILPTQSEDETDTMNPISHLLLLVLDVLPISHLNLLNHLQLLYPTTPRHGSKGR